MRLIDAVVRPTMFTDPDGMEAQDAATSASGFQYSNGYTTSNSRDETGAVSHEGSFLNADGGDGDGDGDKPKVNTEKTEAQRLGEIVTVKGQKYHKNTSNLFANIGNKINSFFGGSSNYFVEMKSYDPVEDKEMHELFNTSVAGIGGVVLGKGAGLLIGGIASKVGMTTVGRWMSKAEYEIMANTGQIVEGAGGQTFVATGGSGAFTAAAKGSVYAEFQVSTSSLIQGGQSNWYKILGPSAKASQQYILQKQGGELLPQIQNLSKILQTK